MRILFLGTPQFAAISLEYLLEKKFEIIGVVTQPDRPRGRGMTCQPSEVKMIALQSGLPVWQPESVSSPDFINVFRQLRPSLVIVVAFGQKIPPEILFEPKYGCVNLHGSLLPRYRGAAPIQWSIVNGDPITGVTTMYMDQGWDTGDLIYQEKTTIDPEENFASLYQRLAILGSRLLAKTVAAIATGCAPRIPQDDHLASLAPKLPLQFRLLEWNNTAEKIHNLVRVFAPAPGVETILADERLKILETKLSSDSEKTSAMPGEIMEILKRTGIIVATGSQPLLITKLQPAGKREMAASDYANGRRLKPGMFFGKKE